jgi:F-type H+-transporting ATPase subunit delta
MSIATKERGPATAYATALLQLANEQNQGEAIGQELAEIGKVLETTPSFRAFLTDPAVSENARQRMLEKVFKGRVSPRVFNTMGVLNHNRRMALLPAVIEAYRELLDKQLGKIEVDVIVAQKLGPMELEQVQKRISQAIGKQAVVRQKEDPSLIGGLVIRIEDKLIDGSVRSQLEAMRRRLLSAAR